MFKPFYILSSLFFVLSVFFLGNPTELNAGTCVPSGGPTSKTISTCTWEEADGNFAITGSGNATYGINNVDGYIPVIEANNTDDGAKHEVTITRSLNLEIGRMHVTQNGKLNIRDSKVLFSGEGLRTGEVKIFSTDLTLSGGSSINKIDTLEIDEQSNLYLKDGASLEIKGGKGIQGKFSVESSKLIFDYNEVPVGDEEVFFGISDIEFSGENSEIKKKGEGRVVFTKSSFLGTNDVKITVDGGILDIGRVGNRLGDATNTTVNNGQLRLGGGSVNAIVGGNFSRGFDGAYYCTSVSCGELYYYSAENINGTIEVNKGQAQTGKLTVDAYGAALRNSSLDVVHVKSGSLNFTYGEEANKIKHLVVEGGLVTVREREDFGKRSIISNIEILEKGTLSYHYGAIYENENDPNSNAILKSLIIANDGRLNTANQEELVLDGSKIDINIAENGIISTGSAAAKLTLLNMNAGIVEVSGVQGINSLVIGENVYIHRLDLRVSGSESVFDVDTTEIGSVNMLGAGILNITQDAKIKDLIIQSGFNPKVNVTGGEVENFAVNNRADVNIGGDAKIGSLHLAAAGKVVINGGEIGNLNIDSAQKDTELDMIGGKIETFRLKKLIKFSLKDTEITNYEIGVEDETFDFTQEKVKNLFLTGKNSTVNLGDGEYIPVDLRSLTVDYGTLIYHYEQDKYLEKLWTDVEHLFPEPPAECEEGDKKCEEEREEEEKKEITYDSEVRIKAGNATLTVGEVKLENLVIESGNLVVEEDMEIIRRLNLGLDVNNKTNASNSSYKIHSMGTVKLGGLLEVDFNSTYDALLGVDNQFDLIYAHNGIEIDDETAEFKFLTNLADWFEVTPIFSKENLSSYRVNIKREKLYTDVLGDTGHDGVLLDVSSILDGMIVQNGVTSTDAMKSIISGLDTNSGNAYGLANNLKKLLPVSNRAYANSMHANTNKIVDNLSFELRDFTNLEDNAWVKMQTNITTLKDNKDVVGYTEDSNMFQAGYTTILNSKLILGGSFSYVGGDLNGSHANYTQNFTTFNLALGADYLLSSEYYVKGIVSYGTTVFDNTRNLSFISSSATSDLNAQEVMGHFELGYVTILPDKYKDFNASYNVFYSVSSISIDSYIEEGIGKLNVGGANVLINDLGLGATFDKEILYDRDGVSLKPSASFAMGVRLYSGADTNFSFQDIGANSLSTTNGSYLPMFFKTRVGIDYLTDWSNISVGYRYETDATKYNDSAIYLSFKRSF